MMTLKISILEEEIFYELGGNEGIRMEVERMSCWVHPECES